jgi:putative methionine-R-sulfoxide reductase with GAF domain
MARDYSDLVQEATSAKAASRDAAMQTAVRLLWRALGNRPISWVGFYDKVPGAQEMVLVCREPKPACSPIGLHGMCGRSYLTRQSILVADVRTLGESYIACDPKDQSELVVPLVDAKGVCSGVLDVDSYDLNGFDEADVQGMNRLLCALDLTHGTPPIARL